MKKPNCNYKEVKHMNKLLGLEERLCIKCSIIRELGLDEK